MHLFKRKILFLSLVVTFAVLSGCGKIVRRNAIIAISEIFEEHFEVFTSEADPVLAENSTAANLKFIDIFIAEKPDSEKLLILASKSYSLYTFFFIEGKILKYRDTEEEEVLRERARVGYRKAISYAKRALKICHPSIFRALDGKEEDLKKSLGKVEDIKLDSIFWLAYSLGGYANLNRDDPGALINIGKAKILMNAVLQRDESFFYAGPHIFFAVYYSSLPVFAGGNLEKSEEHFNKAASLTQNKLLLIPYFRARYYASMTLNQQLFEEKLKLILNAPRDILPSLNLANVLSKQWAATLLKKADMFF